MSGWESRSCSIVALLTSTAPDFVFAEYSGDLGPAVIVMISCRPTSDTIVGYACAVAGVAPAGFPAFHAHPATSSVPINTQVQYLFMFVIPCRACGPSAPRLLMFSARSAARL